MAVSSFSLVKEMCRRYNFSTQPQVLSYCPGPVLVFLNLSAGLSHLRLLKKTKNKTFVIEAAFFILVLPLCLRPIKPAKE